MWPQITLVALIPFRFFYFYFFTFLQVVHHHGPKNCFVHEKPIETFRGRIRRFASMETYNAITIMNDDANDNKKSQQESSARQANVWRSGSEGGSSLLKLQLNEIKMIIWCLCNDPNNWMQTFICYFMISVMANHATRQLDSHAVSLICAVFKCCHTVSRDTLSSAHMLRWVWWGGFDLLSSPDPPLTPFCYIWNFWINAWLVLIWGLFLYLIKQMQTRTHVFSCTEHQCT